MQKVAKVRLSDIVFNIGYKIPRFTNRFSEILTFTSFVASNGVVTVATSTPTGLQSGVYVTVHNMFVKHNVVSLVSHNGLATCIIDSDHDLTRGWQPTVTIEGANESAYNGIHELIDVPNRRTFIYKIDPNAPTTATGGSTIKFDEYLERGFDGAYPITVIDATHFSFTIPGSTINLPGFYGNISLGQRVLGAVSIDRFLEMYEKTSQDKYYAVVVMEDATTSKNRALSNDSIASLSASQDMRQLLIEPFSIYVVAPAKNDLAAVEAIDLMYEEIRNAMLHTVWGVQFPTGLDVSTYSGAALSAHGMYAYNKAWYVHQYAFETVKEITIDDSYYIDPSAYPTRAFRDIIYNIENDFGNIVQHTNMNLDDQPL